MTFRRALAFAEAGIAICPVRLFGDGDRLRKVPLIREWPTRASADISQVGEWWRQWPDAVPGIPLELYGRAVVDADRHPGKPDGVAAVAALGPMPAHPIVATASGGEHHYFAQPDPPIAGKPSFAPGIDLLGVGRFVVGYDLAPLLALAAPALPEVFRRADLKRNPTRCVSLPSAAAGLTEALWLLDPCAFREHDRWFELMTACRSVGISRDDFIAWSTGDPLYARDARIIGARWDSLKPGHGGALYAALKQGGINTTTAATHPGRVPSEVKASNPTHNVARRADAIQRSIERAGQEGVLFNAWN